LGQSSIPQSGARDCRLCDLTKLFMVSGVGCQVSVQPPAQKTASLIKEKKLMNVEHRTSNIEHRIMYSVCYKY